MKSRRIIPLFLYCFFVFCPPTQAAPSPDDSRLFSCPTDDGDNITQAKREGRLILTYNGKSDVLDETVREIRQTYRRSIRTSPEYNVVSVHINGMKYSPGSCKTLATQAEPTGQFFSYCSDKHRIPDVICSLGENVNQLSALAK